MLSTLLSALGSLGTSAINNTLMSNRADKESRQNLANAKDLANFQHSLALSDYALQRNDFIKDALLGDLRAVQSRQNAGLSTAFSKGFSPVQPLGGSVPNGYTQSFAPSNVASSMHLDNPLSNDNLLIGAQIKNLEANTDKTNKDAGLIDAQTVYQKRVIDQFNATFDDNVALVSQNLKNAYLNGELTKKNYEHLSQVIENLKVSGKLQQYDLENIKPLEVNKLTEEINKLVSDISVNTSVIGLNKAHAHLAKVQSNVEGIKAHFMGMGIGVGNSLFDSILSFLTAPNATKTWPLVKDNFVTILKDMFTSLADGVNSLDEETGGKISMPGKAAWKRIKSAGQFSERQMSAAEKIIKGDMVGFTASELFDFGLPVLNWMKEHGYN